MNLIAELASTFTLLNLSLLNLGSFFDLKFGYPLESLNDKMNGLLKTNVDESKITFQDVGMKSGDAVHVSLTG